MPATPKAASSSPRAPSMTKKDRQRRRATAQHNRNAWARRNAIRPLLFEADALAIAAAFGKPLDFPPLDYAQFYRAAWDCALKLKVRDPSETVSQAMRLFLNKLARHPEPMDSALVAWEARRLVRYVEAYNACRWRQCRTAALSACFPLGDKSDDAPEAVAEIIMDWDALKRLTPDERHLALSYLRWLASTIPADAIDLCSGGTDYNANISISRFARDTMGLSKSNAWIHAKRVIAAFREGLYTI